MVDSIPILLLPPLTIYLIFFLNSSLTSETLTGLNLDEIFALGAARGKFICFKIFLVIL